MSIACIAWSILEYITTILLAFYKQVKRVSGGAARAVEHPIHIKESLGMIRGKNDKVDAQRIAFYAYKNREEVHLWTPKREVIQKLDGWPLPSVNGYPQSAGQSA
ncbi:hypothetical protein [Spirosoma flavum]|uniref:Transposase IS111A/IS1328/IS1533 N-terminal domain-containing protein n=1 Tax=Spirosoma flavum TaxID=2048557 RepID=A0ABW6AGQ1_9BACT